MISGNLSIKYGLKGPNFAIMTACTTGTHNIDDASRLIDYGDSDVMVAGVVVLEEYEHAKARGAKIYAEVSGYGMSGDAYHMTLPSKGGEGAARCMKNAMRNAAINTDQIDYINAHGTSTPAGDQAETDAAKLALGDHAYNLVMSSTKSMTGHLLGAAGGIEAIFTALAIRDQVAPPTINIFNQDEGCDLDYAANEAREMKIEHAISNSFGFGGTNGSILLSKI